MDHPSHAHESGLLGLEDAALRYEPHGCFEANGARGHHRAWIPIHLPRLVRRVREQFDFCDVFEHARAHSLQDKTEAAYQRGDLLEKRVRLMQAWSDYCFGHADKNSA